MAPKKRKLSLVNLEDVPKRKIDSNSCYICGVSSSSTPLRCPATSSNYNAGQSYKTLAEDIFHFYSAGALDNSQLHLISSTKNSDELASYLLAVGASFHKPCRDQYNEFHLQRVLKRFKQEEVDEANIKTRDCFSADVKLKVCFFCNCRTVSGVRDDFKYLKEVDYLTSAATFDIDRNVRYCAEQLSDVELLAKLSSGDMIAIDARYHKACLTKLYNRQRSFIMSKSKNEKNQDLFYGLVIQEVLDFVNETYRSNQDIPVLKLADIVKYAEVRLETLKVIKRINHTRLKELILKEFPSLEAIKKGREIVFVLREDIGECVSMALENLENDGATLTKAVNILRRDMFDEYPQFNGKFTTESIAQSVSPVLLSFIRKLLEGNYIANDPDLLSPETKAVQTISQLVRFNAVKHVRRNITTEVHHPKDRETPLAIYTGIMVHNKTRKRQIVDRMAKLGISISYCRLQQLASRMTDVLVSQYWINDVVLPPGLKKGMFLKAAVDNLNKQSRSRSSLEDFNGTSISFIQNPMTIEEQMMSAIEIHMNMTLPENFVRKLPDSYANVPTAKKPKTDPPRPMTNCNGMENKGSTIDYCFEWLERNSDTDINLVPWGPHLSQKFQSNRQNQCITALLPLFKESVTNPGLIRHVLDILISCTEYINPGQTKVITGDQPVYALLKQTQWQNPNQYGEDKIVVMMGALHIEMCLDEIIGDWLDRSGWTDIMLLSLVTTPGRAAQLLTGRDVKRTMYAHQITIVAVYRLAKAAWKVEQTTGNCKSLLEWLEDQAVVSDSAYYWLQVIKLESLLLKFVGSIRAADFVTFKEAVREICPWTFSLDRYNYARWLPIFSQTLEELPVRHPTVYEHFVKGGFVNSKSSAINSCIPDDQLHEQNNRIVKTDGGADGLFNDEDSLLKWAVVGPELGRLIAEFDEAVGLVKAEENMSHHEDTKAFRRRYSRDVSRLISAIERTNGNPFTDDKPLASMSSRRILTADAVKSIRDASDLGKSLFYSYMTERVILGRFSIHVSINKNNLLLCKTKQPKKLAKQKKTMKQLRQETNLLTQMFIAGNIRPGGCEDYFSHEDRTYPPSLSDDGKLRLPKSKSDFLRIPSVLKHTGDTSMYPFALITDVLIVDGPAIVHMEKPENGVTYKEYAVQYGRNIAKLAEKIPRIDIVFDQYIPTSLKNQTRDKRGQQEACRILVSETDHIRDKWTWENVLALGENKEKLFKILAKESTSSNPTFDKKIVIATDEEDVFSSESTELDCLAPCTHEEADSRIFVHLHHAVTSGCKLCTIRTVDTDVVVLAIFVFPQLQSLEELYVYFGAGINSRIIAIHDICKELGEDICLGLPFWYAFTGCDAVSSFYGITKISAWEAWMSYKEVNEVFKDLSINPRSPEDDQISMVENFTNKLYVPSSNINSVNEHRRNLRLKNGRSIENCPPTQAALIEHIKRTLMMVFHWSQCLMKQPEIPDPTQWGWCQTIDGFAPFWTPLQTNYDIYKNVPRCTCKKTCSAKCKCKSEKYKCTLLCQCDGKCYIQPEA